MNENFKSLGVYVNWQTLILTMLLPDKPHSSQYGVFRKSKRRLLCSTSYHQCPGFNPLLMRLNVEMFLEAKIPQREQWSSGRHWGRMWWGGRATTLVKTSTNRSLDAYKNRDNLGEVLSKIGCIGTELWAPCENPSIVVYACNLYKGSRDKQISGAPWLANLAQSVSPRIKNQA